MTKHLFRSVFLIVAIISTLAFNGFSKEKSNKDDEKSKKTYESIVKGLKFRALGPALTSGRIIDIAVRADQPSEYYVAVASGGVWKTTNAGISYKPIFDQQDSYSIGCVTIDPANYNTVWVGTGENNSQRSVSYGDGVYKSEDGGKSWKNMGLKKSEHIGKIMVDPRNSDVVYVAAQGPLWGPGGDRGLYKTSNGGKDWKRVLEISENTGVSDIVFDSRNPDVIYVSSYQRRRHVWTLINGGPESAIYKTKDGGITWDKLKGGLPGGELGRIGLAISPVNPDYVFALIEAYGDKGGFFRSTDRGVSWTKMNGYKTVSAQYYQEIFCDPQDVDKIYSVDTYSKYTLDGGKTWKRLSNKYRHVDDHALWIDPQNTSHLLIGGDGGMYECFDGGENWDYKANLPITQFYRVAVDNAEPFYNVYGGTQDNNTIGGPSQTTNPGGIFNSDWYITHGGDGFEAAIDPTDPNIVYSQSQHGHLYRSNLKTGEKIGIMPMELDETEAYRWNWNSPLIISKHNHERLYFACNFLFKSDDKGNSWQKISPDLSRQLDRNLLPVMGKVQRPDAVAKNASTSQYGSIVSLSESPLKAGLLYAGTDDGLIQVSTDDGANWTKYERINGLPKLIYVSCLMASRHDEQTVYATFDNRKSADFKPYIYKSTDAGKSWSKIAAGLPENLPVHHIIEDHKKPGLLFIGTEFGVYFSIDDGKEWNKLSAGLPTICVKDIAIQEREDDLVLATFGRGFYVLDNYSALRELSPEMKESEAHLFDIEDAYLYFGSNPLGGGSKGSQGTNYFSTPNPEVAAVFTYYFKEAPKTKKETRLAKEKEAKEKGTELDYPGFDELREEQMEPKSYLQFTIFDANGLIVNRLTEKMKTGINRMTWNFRYPSVYPASTALSAPGKNNTGGYVALPGKYFVRLSKVVNNETVTLVDKKPFTIKPLHADDLDLNELEQLQAFMKDLDDLRRAVRGTFATIKETEKRLKLMKVAARTTPEFGQIHAERIDYLYDELQKMKLIMDGDQTKSKRNKWIPPTINKRIDNIAWGLWRSYSPPTENMKQSYKLAREQFIPLLADLTKLIKVDIAFEEEYLEKMKAPYTPGRIPVYEHD